MKKIVRLTESDLVRIVKRVISEQTENTFYSFLKGKGYKMFEDITKVPNYSRHIKPSLGNFDDSVDIENITYFENLNDSPVPYKLVTDGKTVVFLDNSYPKKVKDSFPNPKGPFKVDIIQKYL